MEYRCLEGVVSVEAEAVSGNTLELADADLFFEENYQWEMTLVPLVTRLHPSKLSSTTCALSNKCHSQLKKLLMRLCRDAAAGRHQLTDKVNCLTANADKASDSLVVKRVTFDENLSKTQRNVDKSTKAAKRQRRN